MKPFFHPSTAVRTGPSGQRRPWLRRTGWLLLIWALSVGALGVAAGLMRMLMHALGMQ